MKNILSTLIALAFAFVAFAQTTITYSDSTDFTKKVPANKAKFAQLVTKNTDSSVITVIKDLKSDKIISSQTYINEEPVGTWIYQVNRAGEEQTDTLNYDFTLEYGYAVCQDDGLIKKGVLDLFADSLSIGYKAPRLATGEQNITDYLIKHVVYPKNMAKNGIQGSVLLQITINREGVVEKLLVQRTRSANATFEKEAARVVRQMRFNPAMLNGQPQTICMGLPVKFKLQ